MRSVFITGIGGFIGRHAAHAFRNAGWQVDGCDKKSGWRVEDGPYMGIEVILHCAANIESLDRRQTGTLEQFDDIALDRSLLDRLTKFPPDRLIWMSSCVAAAQDPLDPYSTVKATGEAMALHFGRVTGVPVHVLRPFSGYGEDQSASYPFVAIADRAIRRENPLTVWSDSVRDWVHVDDICRYILAAANGELPAGKPIPIGTGRPTSFTQLARMFADAVGYKPEISIALDKPAGHPWRVLDERPLLEPTVSLEEGIKRTVAARSHALSEV